MVTFTVTEREDGQKIEKFVKKSMPEAPLGFLFKAFRKKDIKINGHWVHKDAVVHTGDEIQVYVTDAQLADFAKPRQAEKKEFPYEIVYEDDNVIIVNKPAGVLVYGNDKETRETLTQNVLDYLYLKGEFDPNQPSFVPSPAHRLDRNTSGLVIFGKRDAALKVLEELFKKRENISKKYYAIVVGELSGSGRIDMPLKKDSRSGKVSITPANQGGKTAITEWRAVESLPGFTLVECDLITGRTHQIRVHLSAIGHPIAGDQKYGDFSVNKKLKELYGLKDQFLHAYSLEFGKLPTPLSALSGKKFTADLSFIKKSILEKMRMV